MLAQMEFIELPSYTIVHKYIALERVGRGNWKAEEEVGGSLLPPSKYVEPS